MAKDLPNPGGATTGSQTKSAGQEQSHVESKTTANDIRGNTPK